MKLIIPWRVPASVPVSAAIPGTRSSIATGPSVVAITVPRAKAENASSNSAIAGASLVRKNVPPFVKAAREPLSYVGVNVVGLRRRGYDDAAVARIEDIYREIFVRNTNVDRAVQSVEQQLPRSPERGQILDFIRNSPKGIMRGLAE